MTQANAPRVTVVIPTFDRAAMLRRAIDSVLEQTLDDFELFISDNASDDDTAVVVASYDDPRIVYAPLETNLGPIRNFTRSLYLGIAPAVTLLQDDDLMRPENLERKVQLLTDHPEMVVAHSAFSYIDEDDKVIKPWATWSRLHEDAIESGPTFIERSLQAGCRIDFSAAVMRRTAIVGERFRAEDGPPCDMGLWLRLARRGSVGYLADPLLAVRRHAESRTISDGTYAMGGSFYRPTFEGVELVQGVKRRFLDEFGNELPDPDHLRRDTRRAGRKQLLAVAAERNRPGTLRGLFPELRTAARVDRGVATDPRTARLCVESAIGRPIRLPGRAPAASARASAPFPFVVGCPRSGTTLLRAMLDSHPELSIPPESYFVSELANRAGGRWFRPFSTRTFQTALFEHERFVRWHLPPDVVAASLARARPTSYTEALRVVYSTYADAHGKSRYGDKTPAYVLELPLLARLFPEARFVHIVRDGRDVALSLVEIDEWGPTRMVGAARYWVQYVEAGRAAGRALGPGRYREVHYEALVEDPETVLRECCEFFELEFDVAMLEYPGRVDELLAGNIHPEIHTRLQLAPTKGLRCWPEQMSDRDQDAFVAIAGPLLDDLGYGRPERVA